MSLSGLNPLIHYIEYGVAQGYRPGPLFSGPADWEMDRGVAAVARAKYGWEGCLDRLFDADWYLERYPDATPAGVGPLTHYLKSGAAAGYDPHPMFCTTWYLDRYPDVASVGVNPLVHYVKHGAFEGRDPHPLFDTSWYLKRYPEVSLSGLNPLIHYIEYGVAQGYRPGPLFSGPADWEMDRGVAAAARAKYDWEVDRFPPAQRAQRPPGRVAGRIVFALSLLGRHFYGQSRFALASSAFRVAYFLSAARQDELLALLAKCAIRRGKFDQRSPGSYGALT